MPAGDETIEGLYESLDKWGAATASIVARDENDVALRAIIVVKGQPETEQILAAIQQVQDRWDTEEPLPCTCTVACIPQGITAEQTCRLRLENEPGGSEPQ